MVLAVSGAAVKKIHEHVPSKIGLLSLFWILFFSFCFYSYQVSTLFTLGSLRETASMDCTRATVYMKRTVQNLPDMC